MLLIVWNWSLCVFLFVYEIYLSVRRGGDILVWFSPLNGGSCFGCKTGVRPHLSIKSIREMVADVVQGTIILLSCICTLKKVHLLICSGYDTFSDRYKSANEYMVVLQSVYFWFLCLTVAISVFSLVLNPSYISFVWCVFSLHFTRTLFLYSDLFFQLAFY